MKIGLDSNSISIVITALLAGAAFAWRRESKPSETDPPRGEKGESETSSQQEVLAEEELSARIQLRHALREINDLKHDFQKLAQINNANLYRYHTLFNYLPMPCFTINQEGAIIEWNITATEFFGKKVEEVIGHSIADVLGDSVRRGHAQEVLYQAFLGLHPEPVQIEVNSPAVGIRSVNWVVSPIKNEKDETVGVVNTIAIVQNKNVA